MIVLVTGDRKWDNLEVIYEALKDLPDDTVIVHGYAQGADSCADVIATELGLKVHRCPAHWSCTAPRHVEVYGPCDPDCDKVSGPSAGILRNTAMLMTYRPNQVFAFHNDLVNSKGTKNMVNQSLRARIPVHHFMDSGCVCVY